MELNIEQKKLVQSKPSGHSLIRGVAGSGKTTIAVNRIPFLLENYCPDDDDGILILTYNKSLINYIKYAYDKISNNREFENLSLFKVDKNKVCIKNIDSVIYRYFKQYCNENKLDLTIESRNPIIENIIIRSIVEVGKLYSDIKIISQKNLNFIKEEIFWIKSCNYLEVEEYQNADRLGRMSSKSSDSVHKLHKNSRTRSAIFKVLEIYNYYMRQKNKADFYDVAIMALEQIKKYQNMKYTHIICDESQDLTRVQLEFIKYMSNNKEYSSILFLADTAQSIYTQSWLVKGRSFASVGFDVKGKSNILAKNYRTTTQIAETAYSLLENDLNIIEDENFVKPSLLDKQGTYPVFRQFLDKDSEMAYVIKLIERLSENYKLGDIVIIARKNGQINECGNYIEKAHIPFKIMSSNDGYEFGDDKLKIMTMHSIKGLEFKVVIMIGLNSNCVSLKGANSEYEEYHEMLEKKLMYVGMTRAMEKLYITCDGFPSKFINDINPKFLRFSEDSMISKFYNIQPQDYSFNSKIKDIYSLEEKVRQWLVNELKTTYKYPEKLIDIEYQVNNFSRIGFVDIVVFNYNNRNKEPFIFVEVKKSGSGLSNCIEQLKSYMSTTQTCKYGIASDGIELMVLNREFQQEKDIPSFESSMLPSSLEKYSYIDLKNNKRYDFMRDYDSKKEILVENDKIYPVEDIIRLNIYENIAAGPPILMNSTVEDEFYFPKTWLHNTDDCYMVKVKGNSMINANIDNGDIVIIKRQNMVDNYEIAAVDVDGNTTLKRFVRMGDTILLMPENPDYEPINISEGQVAILGKAVGVLKLNSSKL